MKLFGKYITRLPDYNLTRHEDVPLPMSSACHSREQIKPVKFIPCQDLSGSMIPMTCQDVAKSQARKRKERELLVGEYQKRLSDKAQSKISPEEDNLDEGVELIGSEDRYVCYSSESAELCILNQEKRDITDAINSGNNSTAIQLTMGNQLQFTTSNKLAPAKSKWVFSASLQLSLKQEMIEEVPAAALCDDTTSSYGRIEYCDDMIAEEGVEIVPLGSSADDGMTEHELLSTLQGEDDINTTVLFVKGGRGIFDTATEGYTLAKGSHG